MSDSKRLAEIAARVAKATEGPWGMVDGDNTVYSNPREAKNGFGTNFDAQICEMVEDMDTDDISYEDAEFIAHARDDVPWLLDQLAKARELLRRLDEQAQDYKTEWVREVIRNSAFLDGVE